MVRFHSLIDSYNNQIIRSEIFRQVVSQVFHIRTLLADNLCLSSAAGHSHLFLSWLRFAQLRFAHLRHVQPIIVLPDHILQVVLAPLDFPFGHTPIIFVIFLSNEAVYIRISHSRKCKCHGKQSDQMINKTLCVSYKFGWRKRYEFSSDLHRFVGSSALQTSNSCWHALV